MSRREYCLRTATGRKALNSPLVPSATGLLGSMNKLLPCWRYSARTLMRLWTLKKSRNACAPLRGIIRAFFKKCSHLLLSFGKPADNMASDPLGESLTRTLRYFRYVVLWSTRPLITSLESLLARSSISTHTTVRLKVEQIQLLSVVGLFRCGLIAREGASKLGFLENRYRQDLLLRPPLFRACASQMFRGLSEAS